jgi:AraC family transcriptional regulator
MMNLDGARKYHARMQRVLDYIDAHIDEDLSVDVLAGVAAFSPRHFHRQFSELFGVNVYRYVQLTRLRRASYRLAFREDEPVTRIALDSGYEGPEAFSRAFRRSAGQTPSAFREQPDWASWRETYGSINDARRTIMTIGFTDDQVKIVDFPETQIAILRHRGDPAAIGDSIRRFIAWRKQTGLSPRTSRTFGILHHDPETTAPEDYRQDLCAATTQIIAPNAQGVIAGSIPAGRCASLRLIGPGDNLRFAARFLYADWLPRSQEELRDFPVFIQRVSFFPDVAEKDAITDIFLPLK